MKKIVCVAAVISLAAPAAFAQADGSKSFGAGGGLQKTDMVFLPGEGPAPEIASVASAVRNELERSRQIEPVYVDDDRKAKLAVPLAVEKDATGEKMTVTFRLTSAQRLTADAQVTCATSKPATCAREIVTQAEKFARENRTR